MKYLNHLVNATKYTMKGILYALKNETAAKIELVAIVFALIVANVIATNIVEYILLIGVVITVFALEMLNTAIEAIVDEDGRHTELYGVAKDCGSAAVGIMIALGLFIWASMIIVNIFGITGFFGF